MFIYNLGETPYNLRFKGKMTSIDNPAGNALVVADNPGGSGGRDETRKDGHVG